MRTYTQDKNIPATSFQAKLGKNLTQELKKEFKYNSTKLEKFEKIFQDAFKKNIDENTILDINKENKLMFSHSLFPRIKYCQNYKLPKDNFLGKRILNECAKTIANDCK